MKKNENIKKVLILITLIILIITICIFHLWQKSKENFNNIKEDKNKYLVYSRYQNTSTTYPKEIPYINMKSQVIASVNEDIALFCNDFFESEKSVISYEYDISGIILSVVVKVIDNETEYAPEPYFRTYNINLETEEVISDDALLQFFEVNTSIVEEKIKEGFEKFYNGVIMDEYFDPTECNYECFLKWRGVENYLENIVYYVKEGKLIAYKPFTFYSLFGEENYFKDSDFEFTIATAPNTN